MGKQKLIALISVIALALLAVSFPYIKYAVTGGSSVLLEVPENFYFNYDGSTSQGTLLFIELESGKKTYHIETPSEYLNGDGYAYITGWINNSPFAPVVNVNGERCKASIDRSDNIYHFYIRNIVPEEKYRIYIRCGDKNDYINVYFDE
ncbi:MAG: hypothetical protein VB078_06875 [Clostridiaceae bacterium]|nr:hypothetical protein [Clostridiaceae bacterium]